MTIWFNKDLSLEDIKSLNSGTMGHHLAMEWVELGADFIKMKMPVDDRTKQPYGLLHGGASCALAETTGSVASALVTDPSRNICVGLEINANHIRSVRDGFVTATCTPLHLGSSTHVWDIKIHGDMEKLVCVSRLTVAILKKPV
ncbi:MAG: hotdog fold thioesterase [Ferruginibacter sp.]